MPASAATGKIGVDALRQKVVWNGLVHGLSPLATDFAERRDAKFKGEFVAKYVPESTVSVETGRRKAGAEKSLLIPSTDRTTTNKRRTDADIMR